MSIKTWYSRTRTWFEGLNRKQKNVVVTASTFSLLSIIFHNPLGGYYGGYSREALMDVLKSPNDLFLVLFIIISLGGLLLYIFRDE